MRPWDEAALQSLRWHWGDAYAVSVHGAAWQAVRRDGLGAVTANSAEQLREAILADYTARAVPR